MTSHHKHSSEPAPESNPEAEATVPAAADAPEVAETHDEKKSRWGGKKHKEIEVLTKAKDEAEQAKALLHDRLLRLQADFDNFRKRNLRERAELIRTANEDLVVELLPVVDNLELALGAEGSGAPGNALLQGIKMVREQLVAALTKFGLQPIDAMGQPFDTACHEAISHLPSATVPENGIIAQTRRGYRLGDKLIRPVQVVVSSGNPDAPAAPEAGA